MAVVAGELMDRDISRGDDLRWAARTAGGMVVVELSRAEVNRVSGADLVTLRNMAGDVLPARMIGPLGSEAPDRDIWRIDGYYRVDPEGEPVSTIAPGTAQVGPDIDRHDWGALGLADGFETRVRPSAEPACIDEAGLARASSGHRHGERTWWLTLAPGDRVSIGNRRGIVLAIDRRKRTVEVDVDGEARFASLDEVSTQETT